MIARRHDERRRRAKLLRVLIGICRRIERLEGSAEARLACRQVAELLTVVLGRERTGRGLADS
ncbi:MAG TPA: hypothetical protein VG710_15395 [Opitutus sp.]|nr:hypothetical protein [Opitutus sp.]